MMAPGAPGDPNPYAQRPRPLVRRALGKAVGILAIPILVKLLEREKIRQFVIHRLSDRLAMEEASFVKKFPATTTEVSAFEDCAWLFSSNELNHGLARLTFEEGAFLFRLVKSLQEPLVAELGRYKGGSTFLMAAAGARVLSLDNDALPGQVDFMEALERALSRVGLDDRVENLLADAQTYPFHSAMYNLVFHDPGPGRHISEAIFEHWWHAVKPGGYYLFRDGKRSPLVDVVAMVSQLDLRSRGGTIVPGCPGSFVLLMKNLPSSSPE